MHGCPGVASDVSPARETPPGCLTRMHKDLPADAFPVCGILEIANHICGSVCCAQSRRIIYFLSGCLSSQLLARHGVMGSAIMTCGASMGCRLQGGRDVSGS